MPWNQNGDNPWGGGSSGGDDGGSGGRGRGDNPWGGGGGGNRPPERPPGGGGNGGGPDFSEWFKRGRQKLPGGFSGGPSNLQIGLLAAGVILGIVLLRECFFRVMPNERGLVTTFGAWDEVEREPGLHLKLPRPFQDVTVVNVDLERRTEIGRDEGERFMITADENIVAVRFVVQWRVSNAGFFQFNILDQENTLRKAAESLMREVVGRTPVERAITTDRILIADETQEQLQALMTEYEAGIEIEQVNVQEIDLPTHSNPELDVIRAFNDVQAANQERETLRNQAERYRQDIVPNARGEKAQMINLAEGFKTSIENRARGEASRFLSVLQAYRGAEDVTRQRLYLETMEAILRDSRKVLMDPNSNGGTGGGLVPYLPLNDLPAPRRSSSPLSGNQGFGLPSPSMTPQPQRTPETSGGSSLLSPSATQGPSAGRAASTTIRRVSP